MQKSLGLLSIAAVFVAAVWWWLGGAVSMPPSPLKAGENLNCVSYAPYRGLQTPLDLSQRIEPWQIDEDLAKLSSVTDCVRTYSVDAGWEHVPEIARRHGLQVLLGIWVSGEAERTKRQIETGIALANSHADVVRAVIVGNETLLRKEVTAEHLASLIATVGKQVQVPVTYADVWEFWLQNPQLAKVTDFITIHILPYWEDYPIPAADAAAHVSSIRQRVADTFPDQEVFIGEVGWPSAGRMRWGARPSRVNQAHVLHEVLHRASAENFTVNIIEAFDQPWKRALEGTVGGHWGLWTDPPRRAKFNWGEAVSNHPYWIWQAFGGIAFAACVFAAGGLLRRRSDKPEPDSRTWIAIGVLAAVSGVMVGWTVESVLLKSLGIGGWLRGFALAAVAFAGPLIGAAALARGVSIPAISEVIGPAASRVGDPLRRSLGWLLIVVSVLAAQTALGLTFNPRYLDFPFAPLTAGLLPLLLVSLLTQRPQGMRPKAETAALALILPCAAYITWNETLANWESLWFVGVLLALAVILVRARAEQGSEAPARQPVPQAAH